MAKCKILISILSLVLAFVFFSASARGGQSIKFGPVGPGSSSVVDAEILLDADRFKLGSSAPGIATTGTNFPRNTLSFDAGTDETMTLRVPIPVSYDNSSDPTITIDWSAVATSNETCWCVQTVTIPDGSAQTALSPTDTDCTSTTVDVTTLFMNKTIITITATDLIAGQTSAITVFRDANESTCNAGDDDMTGDAAFHSAVLSFQVSG